MRRLAGALVCCALVFFPFKGLANSTAVVGGEAPGLRARPLDAPQEVTLDDFRDEVVLLVFVSTWCPHCSEAMETLREWQRRYASEGLRILVLSHEGRDVQRRHFSRSGGLQHLQCTGRTAVRYGANQVPTWVLIDRSGRIQRIDHGSDARQRRAMERTLRHLVSPAPAAASR